MPVISASALAEHADGAFDHAEVEANGLQLADISRAWLATLNTEAFDGRLQSGESRHFILMGDVEPDRGRAILAFAESTLARFHEHIGDVIHFGPAAKMPILTFASDDDYYRYVSAYFSEGQYGLSSGMFIQRGLGHFVFPHEDMWRQEPVIAHELFHATVAHLPLPAWLNEGLATNAEFRFGNRVEDPRHVNEQLPHHRAYWNDERLQDFWSGDAFHQANEGQELSYDLARRLVVGLSPDWDRMKRFIANASADDGGESAAQETFGFSLAVPAEAVLGRTVTGPVPARWRAPPDD
ncbi:MAG: hypothetical protein JNL19_13075 [Burkholderiales bacterium]|nr:hypothetical protein [Burkholderiales bacterium]